jgi:hypothetical protein
MTDKSSAMQVDAALVRQLAELLDENKLTEIEVRSGYCGNRRYACGTSGC